MVNKNKDELNSYVAGQSKKPCLVCKKGGRTVGRLGDIELNYCAHHRKYGERILNFLVRSVFGDELKAFLKESKDDLFMKNKPCLCDDCNEKIAKYVSTMIYKLDDIKYWHEKLQHNTPEDNDTEE